MKSHTLISFTPFACAVALFAAPQFTTLALDQWETTYTTANSHSHIGRFATDTGGTVVASQIDYGVKVATGRPFIEIGQAIDREIKNSRKRCKVTGVNSDSVTRVVQLPAKRSTDETGAASYQNLHA